MLQFNNNNSCKWTTIDSGRTSAGKYTFEDLTLMAMIS